MAFLCSLFSVMGNLNHGCYRSGNGQGKILLQGSGKVREFPFKLGKIDIIWKKSGRSEILRGHIFILFPFP